MTFDYEEDFEITRGKTSVDVFDCDGDFVLRVPKKWTNTQIYKCLSLMQNSYRKGLEDGKREKVNEIKQALKL